MSKTRKWEAVLRRFFDGFSLVGGILFISGLLLLVLATALKIVWLHDAGGTLFVAGLSLTISTAISKEAVRQQYAKEANVRRKEILYGPLYTELKQLWERFDQASRGLSPYPHWIFGVGNVPSPLGLVPPYKVGTTFKCWPEFKDSHYLDQFTKGAYQLFNEVQKLAATYNKAVVQALTRNCEILQPYLVSATEGIKNSSEYREWQQQNEVGTRIRVEKDDWYERVERISMTVGQEEAQMWLDDFWVLGWILANSQEKAAITVQNGYHSISLSLVPLTWSQEIFQHAWVELNKLPENQEIQQVATLLFEKVRMAKDLVESSLRYIRDHYEGGEPLV